MKPIRIVLAVGAVLVTSALVVAQSPQSAQPALSAEAQLKAAMNRETVQRDLTGAIEQYKLIASTFATNHAVASKALLQLGGIYERQGKPGAQAAYQRILSEYADSGATVATARTRLARLQEAGAGPFSFKSLDAWLKDASQISASPDGKHLLYAREKKPGAAPPELARSLWVRDISTGQERLLVDAKPGQWPYSAVWSPDSQRVASYWMVVGGGLELRFTTVATAESRTLAKAAAVGPAQIVWSPDSRMAALGLVASRHGSDTQFDLRLASVGTTETLLLDTTTETLPSTVWSRDSRRLAYATTGTDADVIHVVTVGSKDATSISMPKAKPSYRTTLKAWTPTGQLFVSQAVEGGQDSFLIDPAGGTPKKVCEGRGASGGDGCQDLSPDGVQLILRKNVSGGGRVVLKNVKDNSERPLTPEAVLEQTAVGFSPDSRLFAFRSNRDGGYGLYVAPVDRIPVSAPLKILQLESDGSGVTGSWTSQGLVIRVTNNQTNQYRIDLDSARKPIGSPVRLTEDSPVNVSAQVSPDGKRIAYISRGRPTGFALMDANGAHERVFKEVPPDMLIRMDIHGWLNENQLFITDAGPGTGNLRSATKKIQALNVTTGEIRPAGPDVTGNAIWMAGGGNLVYMNAKDDFVVRPIAGGPERVIHLDNWWDHVVSTGGNWMAYTTGDDSAGRDKPMPGDIRVRSLETGAEKVIAKWADTNGGDHAPLEISADGRYLVYQDPSLKLFIANVESGQIWPLLTNPPAGVDFDNAGVHFSPDGSYLVIRGDISRSSWRAYNGVTYDAVTKILGPKK